MGFSKKWTIIMSVLFVLSNILLITSSILYSKEQKRVPVSSDLLKRYSWFYTISITFAFIMYFQVVMFVFVLYVFHKQNRAVEWE